MRLVATMAVVWACSGCAILHHAQVGDIDNRKPGRPFDIKISETGVAVDEIIGTAGALSRNSRDAGAANDIWGMFHMGPTTGEAVFNDRYAEGLIEQLYKECPSGQITGLVAVRETRKYPYISGEIVKVSGYCRK